MTDFLPPQLASATSAVPLGPDWRFELKYDGYRAQVHVADGKAQIFTRTGLDWTCRFPQLVRDIERSLGTSCVLDGEVCALDPTGRPNFTELCGKLNGGGSLHFFAFDLLSCRNADIRHLPLRARYDLLGGVVTGNEATVQRVKEGSNPDELLAFVRQHAWEGIVAKRWNSVYQAGVRGPNWLKIKAKHRQEFIIAGWRPDAVSGAVKSLVLATLENGRLTHRGSVGTGFSQQQRRELPQVLANCTRLPCPTVKPAYIPVQPSLVADVEFLELSDHGIVRQPTFVGLRCDKPASDVQLERA